MKTNFGRYNAYKILVQNFQTDLSFKDTDTRKHSQCLSKCKCKKKKPFQIGVLLLMNEDPQLVPHQTQKTINTGEGSGKEDEKKWDKIFSSYTSDRDLMPRIYKEF